MTGPKQTTRAQSSEEFMETSTCPTSRRLTLNVRGHLFQTTVDTLRSLPHTRLGRLATDTSLNHQPDTHLFFDRNPEIMNSILDLYSTGELHVPKHLCCHTIERELQFWGIPSELIHECCYQPFEHRNHDAEITREIQDFLDNPYNTDAAVSKLSRWNRVWLIMERPRLCRASKIWGAIFITVVLVAVLVYTVQTSMEFRTYEPWVFKRAADHNMTIEAFANTLNLAEKFFESEPNEGIREIEYTVFTFFVVEYVVRLATCPSKAYFFRQFRSWLDLFLIVQHGVGLTLEHVVVTGWNNFTEAEHNTLHIFLSLSNLRVLRIFYLAKDFDAMKVLLLSTKASLKALGLLTVSLFSMATVFGAFVYLAELLEEGFTFQSIPYGVWYAVVTMTTVGYGDYYPVTLGGRVIGGLCALSGLIVLALPITVIATNYNSYRENLVTTFKQMRTRMDYLTEHPEFCLRPHDSDNSTGPEFEKGGMKHVNKPMKSTDDSGPSQNPDRNEIKHVHTPMVSTGDYGPTQKPNTTEMKYVYRPVESDDDVDQETKMNDRKHVYKPVEIDDDMGQELGRNGRKHVHQSVDSVDDIVPALKSESYPMKHCEKTVERRKDPGGSAHKLELTKVKSRCEKTVDGSLVF